MKFVKGKSGNPGGRPKTSLTDALRAVLAEVGPEGKSRGDLIMDKLSLMAQLGNIDAIKLVLERVDGKVPDLHTVDGRLRIDLKWDDGSNE